MFESYEELMEIKLELIDDKRDKRQGSLIYDALAPNSAEIASFYTDLQMLLERTFADCAVGDDLTRRCTERGIYRKEAIKATFYGEFLDKDGAVYDVPIGNRFAIESLCYEVISKEDDVYILECETAGETGNQYLGECIPLDYMENLSTAFLKDVCTDGEDEETDEQLRSRYEASFLTDAFGGNIADYKRVVMALQNVGGVKVYPVWNGGGTVKLVIIDQSYQKPTTTELEKLQEEIDPKQDAGGYGIAPIGHVVTVVGVDEKPCAIGIEVLLESGADVYAVKIKLETIFEEYLASLRTEWADKEELILRISHLESATLEIDGVIDVMNCSINGIEGNYTFGETEIPILAEIEVRT